jgi:hypothetical protein
VGRLDSADSGWIGSDEQQHRSSDHPTKRDSANRATFSQE